MITPSSLVCGRGPGEDTRRNLQAGSNRNILNGREETTGYSSGSRATTRAYRTNRDYYSPVALPFNDKLWSKAKPTPTILLVNPTSRNAKEIICRQRFGVLVRFTFSGMYKPASAPSARSASPGSRVGVFNYRVPRVLGGSHSVENRALVHPKCHNRVHRQHLSVSKPRLPEGPEPYDGKRSRPVLRGLAPSNGGWLLGDRDLTPTLPPLRTGLEGFPSSGSSTQKRPLEKRGRGLIQNEADLLDTGLLPIRTAVENPPDVCEAAPTACTVVICFGSCIGSSRGLELEHP